jgi:hypothetical protein
MKIYVSHSTQYNFKEELYKPLKNSKIYSKHQIILPHDNSDELFNSKDLFNSGCDCVIAEVSTQSLGIGIELGWANSNDIQIICIYRKGCRLSSALKKISMTFIEYETEQDLLVKLEHYL